MTVDGEPCEHKGQRQVSERWVCGNHSTFVSEFGTPEIEQDSTDQEALLLFAPQTSDVTGNALMVADVKTNTKHVVR
jgi:hypothetical protein